MKKLLPITLVSLIMLVSAVNFGCRSSKKALEHGNYYEACVLAVQKLRSSPDNKKAGESLKQAYPLLLQTTKLNINNTQALNTPNKHRTIYNEYVNLNNVYQNILTCPSALRIIPTPQSFMNEQNEAKKQAFNELIAEADGILEEGTHASARRAFFLYGEALAFDPNNSIAKDRQAIALDKAIVRVVLEQIPVVRTYNLSGAFFFDQIFTSLNNDRRNQFLEFYRPEEAEQLQLVPDHVIRMAFDDFVVGQSQTNKSIIDVSKDSVVVGSVKMPDGSTQDVYNTITARFTRNKRTVESKGILSIQITDFSTKQLLSHEKFEGVYVWENTWGSYRGDSRALTEGQLKICDNEPTTPPDTQDLFLEFTKPIFTNASNFLIQFYKNSKYAQ